jgi:hypothetical protein
MGPDPPKLRSEIRIKLLEYRHPQFDVTPLEPPYASTVSGVEGSQVAVLDSNEVLFVYCETRMKINETREGGCRSIRLAHYEVAALDELLAHIEQHA